MQDDAGDDAPAGGDRLDGGAEVMNAEEGGDAAAMAEGGL